MVCNLLVVGAVEIIIEDNDDDDVLVYTLKTMLSIDTMFRFFTLLNIKRNDKTVVHTLSNMNLFRGSYHCIRNMPFGRMPLRYL